MKRSVLLALCTPCFGGPFPAISDAIPASDPRITRWATSATLERGPADILFPDGATAGFGSEADATGPADATSTEPYTSVSLGDGGTATLTFDPPFQDIPGPDFAVFENAFGAAFLELAFVEVSSDGETFHRFPATSLTRTDLQVGSFGGVDPTEVHNLAGKHPAGFGTPFDLAELAHQPALNLQRITHVRIVDVIGTIDPAHASRDAAGRIINDPYPTPFFTGGFDLDAVGAFSTTTDDFVQWAAAQNLPADWQSSRNNIPLGVLFATGNGRLQLEPGPSPLLRFNHLSHRSTTLRLEGSANLHIWDVLSTTANGITTASSPAITVTETGTTLKSITVRLPPGDPRRYFRLAATP